MQETVWELIARKVQTWMVIVPEIWMIPGQGGGGLVS
jgi:hypothetical protein